MAYGHKTGGRTKGVPNKPKPSQKIVHGFISDFVDNYFSSGDFEQDFAALTDPRDKISVVEKLVNYIIPRQNASKLELKDYDEAAGTFAERLAAMAKEQQNQKN